MPSAREGYPLINGASGDVHMAFPTCVLCSQLSVGMWPLHRGFCLWQEGNVEHEAQLINSQAVTAHPAYVQAPKLMPLEHSEPWKQL